jgi:hypothetical protein
VQVELLLAADVEHRNRDRLAVVDERKVSVECGIEDLVYGHAVVPTALSVTPNSVARAAGRLFGRFVIGAHAED